jgi:hypothetical protein
MRRPSFRSRLIGFNVPPSIALSGQPCSVLFGWMAPARR